MILSYKGLATSVFGWVVDRYGDSGLFRIVKNYLPQADMRILFRTYISMVFLTSIFITISSVFIVFFALRFVPISGLLRSLYLVFIPILNGVTAFVILTFYPYNKAVTRKRDIENNLPFALTHMGAIAESGIPPYVIFKLISQFGEYGEIAKEMGKIVRNIDRFGIDPLGAVKDVAEKTPSENFRQILLGFITTTESGGDLKAFLKSAGQQALFDWRIKREKFLQQLQAYAEFYTGLLIAAPLFIIALFSVMSLIQGSISGFNLIDLMKLSIYGIVPILNGAFLMFLKGVEVEI